MPHILFVTGKLAEPALRRVLADVAPRAGFEYSVAVLPISVAALATTSWIMRHLNVPAGVDRVLLPGLCTGDLNSAVSQVSTPIERGPKDLRDLPDFFGACVGSPAEVGKYNIEILAEINHAPQQTLAQILSQARRLRSSGADVIDLGCDPGTQWAGVANTVRALRDDGLRVSIDSFNAVEVEGAVGAGAELVLSINRGNAGAARPLFERYGCEFVVVPESTATLDGIDDVVQMLNLANVPFRIDPILEPIGFGFAASLGRYLEVRRRYPNAAMMMGVGNLTELTDVDSAGLNVLLLGFCEELGIRSVLTTEVINWCRSGTRELDLARRLVYSACERRILPKHLVPELVLLRDPRIFEYGDAELREIAARVTDRNFRVFAEREFLHVFNSQMFLQGSDPFDLFRQMSERAAIDPAHAFYLGYEMAKAVTALTLGKNYVQDQPLRWGFLTMPEKSDHRTITEERGQPDDEPETRRT
jgi:dihydropteroate synthase-like protein